jgi:ATP-dependent DNA helicase RecG
MRDTQDGFVIAEKDLHLRGPGELLGTRQSGLAQMRIADLIRDAHLLPRAHSLAQDLVAQHPEVIQALIDRWLIHSTDYAHT